MISSPASALAKLLDDNWNTAAMLTHFTNENLNYFQWKVAQSHDHPSSREYWSTSVGTSLTVIFQMKEWGKINDQHIPEEHMPAWTARWKDFTYDNTSDQSYTEQLLSYFRAKARNAAHENQGLEGYVSAKANLAKARETQRITGYKKTPARVASLAKANAASAATGYLSGKANLAKHSARKREFNLFERLEQDRLNGKPPGTGRSKSGTRRMVSTLGEVVAAIESYDKLGSLRKAARETGFVKANLLQPQTIFTNIYRPTTTTKKTRCNSTRLLKTF